MGLNYAPGKQIQHLSTLLNTALLNDVQEVGQKEKKKNKKESNILIQHSLTLLN